MVTVFEGTEGEETEREETEREETEREETEGTEGTDLHTEKTEERRQTDLSPRAPKSGGRRWADGPRGDARQHAPRRASRGEGQV